MKRNILLVEPDYRNKYPPIGLMKIATYHRMIGDNVRFFKGDIKNLYFDFVVNECVNQLNIVHPDTDWNSNCEIVKFYLKKRKIINNEIKELNDFSVINCLENYYTKYQNKFPLEFSSYDRIYVTSLFTFYWKITVETIQYAKKFVKDIKNVYVGGVLASLLHKELEEETGIRPMKGLLDKPGILDDNDIIIDDLPLDYSILYEVEYEYPTGSAYFTFMTKGCTRKCTFCSVPILEPTYKPKIDTIDKFAEVKNRFGEQRNLLLMDNNVLASPRFPEIIQEIKDMGFYKGATYIPPNQLDIAVDNLCENYNDYAYLRRSYKLIHNLYKRLRGDISKQYLDILCKYNLTIFSEVTKENLIEAYLEIKPIYEKYRYKQPVHRYVDFNQGTDCRYVTDETMRLMSEIPIRPLRIAFDYIGLRKQYENAIELAAKYNIKDLSNYILFNYKDSPKELYERLAINISLNEKLGLNIYSFPMKYIPLFGEEAKDRFYIGEKWNKKFIRAIQSILNVTKGIVAPGRGFFERAFGKNVDEYFEILYMPEAYIMYRKVVEECGYFTNWKFQWDSLNVEEKVEAITYIEKNNFLDCVNDIANQRIQNLMHHYTKGRSVDIISKDVENKRIKEEYNKLIQNDQSIKLTLTYDYE